MTIARTPIFTVAAGSFAVLLPAAAKPPTWLVWNASPSAPVGLYAVSHRHKLDIGDLLVVRPPRPLAEWLANRRYLPVGVPLLKHLAALPGQRVCRMQGWIGVDGKRTARTLDRDHLGRPLPAWTGCITLGPQQVFLLNPKRRDSLDSRYFGPMSTMTIVGSAHPIWSPGDGR